MKLGPVAFLFVTVIAWAAIRGVMLWPAASLPDPRPQIAWQPPIKPHHNPLTPFGLSLSKPSLPLGSVSKIEKTRLRQAQPERSGGIGGGTETFELVQAPANAPEQTRATAYGLFATTTPPPAQTGQRRLSVSLWAIGRSPSSPTLATAGQLGGSQAGLRARYDLRHGLAAAVRISGPLNARLGKEAAVALDGRPLRSVPMTFTIERRAGLDRGGRDAFAAGMFGGFDSLRVADRTLADGYAQAGIVGARRRDLYIDGSLRAERRIGEVGRTRIGIGAGIWGGAQPGVARLDIGPQLVAHVPFATGGLRIGAEWRQRIAGNARPGSGPALSLGADF